MTLAEKVLDKARDIFSTRDELVAKLAKAHAAQAAAGADLAKKIAGAEVKRQELVEILEGPQRLRDVAYGEGLRHDRTIGAIEQQLRETKPRELIGLEILVARVHDVLKVQPEIVEEVNSVTGQRRTKNLDDFARRRAVSALVMRIWKAERDELPLLLTAEIRERVARYRDELEAACAGDAELEKVLS
jgi:hypothetical protein